MRSLASANFMGAIAAITILAGICGIVACGPRYDPVPAPTIPPAAQPAASTSILTLQKMSKIQNVGLGSPGEVRRATLSSEPVPVVTVRLDALRKYDSKQGLSQLTASPTEVIYPVSVDSIVRSSVTVADVAGNWQGSKYGDIDLAKRLNAVRTGEAKRANVPASSFFMYGIPALGVELLAHKEGEETKLTPIDDDPRFAFKAGHTLSAEEAMRRIVPVARSYNGLPG